MEVFVRKVDMRNERHVGKENNVSKGYMPPLEWVIDRLLFEENIPPEKKSRGARCRGWGV